MADIKTTFDRDLYYAHNYIVIIGEEIARIGFGPYIDILTRSNEQRENAFMIIARGDYAYNLMGIRRGIGSSAGRNIYNIIRKEAEDGKITALTIYDFFNKYYNNREGIVIDWGKTIKKPEIDKSKSGKDFDVVRIMGGAVIKNDKLQGYLTEDEVLGANFIEGGGQSAIVAFKIPEEMRKKPLYKNEGGGKISYQAFKNKTKKDVEIRDGKLHVIINMNSRGIITEINEGIDLSKEEIYREVEKACAKEMESMISRAFERTQKDLNTDIFEINTLVHRRYPKLWKEISADWNNVFGNLDYTINVEVSFADTGLTDTPPSVRKDN